MMMRVILDYASKYLQFATGNRKIQLANMVSTELVTVTDLIIREVEESIYWSILPTTFRSW
jgi:hypothetical protein